MSQLLRDLDHHLHYSPNSQATQKLPPSEVLASVVFTTLLYPVAVMLLDIT
jgi:hypothetical protein